MIEPAPPNEEPIDRAVRDVKNVFGVADWVLRKLATPDPAPPKKRMRKREERPAPQKIECEVLSSTPNPPLLKR